MIKISPSKINLFVDCPRCFYLQLIKKIKHPNLELRRDKDFKKMIDMLRGYGRPKQVLECRINF